MKSRKAKRKNWVLVNAETGKIVREDGTRLRYWTRDEARTDADSYRWAYGKNVKVARRSDVESI